MNLSSFTNRSSPSETIMALGGISWERFNQIESSFDGVDSLKLTYLRGVLEIMSPVGEEHEYVKSTIGNLLETFMRKAGIRFYRRGGFTLKKKGYVSAEPDESYCIGTNKKVPDIVIEVIFTSGSVDKLELYKPQNIPEVWFWKASQLQVFHLTDGKYELVSRSQFFPDLDLEILRHYINYQDQYDAMLAFEARLREEKKE